VRTALHYEFHELENGNWGGLLPDVSAMELWVDIDGMAVSALTQLHHLKVG
jgi:hypothetical protein